MMKKFFVGITVNIHEGSSATPDYLKAVVQDYINRQTGGMVVSAEAFELKDPSIWEELVETLRRWRGAGR